MDNPKGDLIAVLTAQGHTPEFRVATEGAAHARSFSASVWVGGQLLGTGTGSSKREAERRAAEQALAELREDSDHPSQKRTRQSSPAPLNHSPIPLHANVLAEALAVADGRTPKGASPSEVAQAAATLYRELLAELGYGSETQSTTQQ